MPNPAIPEKAVEALATGLAQQAGWDDLADFEKHGDARYFRNRGQGFREEAEQLLADKVLPSLQEAIAERLLSDEAREAAGKAAFLDRFPDVLWDGQLPSVQMSWEGNAAAGVEAAIKEAMSNG